MLYGGFVEQLPHAPVSGFLPSLHVINVPELLFQAAKVDIRFTQCLGLRGPRVDPYSGWLAGFLFPVEIVQQVQVEGFDWNDLRGAFHTNVVPDFSMKARALWIRLIPTTCPTGLSEIKYFLSP